MAKELLVALEIAHSELAGTLLGFTKNIPGVKVLQWTGSLGEKGALAVKTVPDIIIVDDDPVTGNLLNRVRLIKNNFPQASLFVVSPNRDPQNIIDVMKAGATEYLVEPVSDRTFANAVEEVRARLANAGRLAQGNIYSFISAKGGIGTTVLAVNTAVAMALPKKDNVAMLDMSLQSGDASVLLDMVPQTTIFDICQNIHRLDVAFLRGVVIGHNTGLNFLAAPQNPEDADEVRSEHVASILELARRLYDQIVVDCSSMNVSDCSVEVFRRSNKIFIVSDMSVPSIRNSVRLSKLIRKLGISADKIEFVINRYLKDSVLSLAEIEKTLDKAVYWMIPSDFADIIASINRGTPLVRMNPSAPFSRNLAQFVLKLQNQLDDANFRGIRGMFGKSL